MIEKFGVLGAIFITASLVGLTLLWLAMRGKNMNRFGDRQRLQDELYRFTVMICTALAFYHVGRGFVGTALPLPDGVWLFLTTAGPAWLLCTIGARWYLGLLATLLVQTFWLVHLASFGAFHTAWQTLLPENALLDLAGVALYALTRRWQKRAQDETEEKRSLMRFWLKSEESR